MTASEGAKTSLSKWRKEPRGGRAARGVCEREAAAPTPDDASDRELGGSGGN